MKSIFLNRKSSSENDDSNGKPHHGRFGSLLLGFALAMVSAGPAIAGPTGGEVVGGEGSITHDGALTQIDQMTGRISINWDTFNTATNETVRFVQPSSSAVALNTIFDQNASRSEGVFAPFFGVEASTRIGPAPTAPTRIAPPKATRAVPSAPTHHSAPSVRWNRSDGSSHASTSSASQCRPSAVDQTSFFGLFESPK